MAVNRRANEDTVLLTYASFHIFLFQFLFIEKLQPFNSILRDINSYRASAQQTQEVVMLRTLLQPTTWLINSIFPTRQSFPSESSIYINMASNYIFSDYHLQTMSAPWNNDHHLIIISTFRLLCIGEQEQRAALQFCKFSKYSNFGIILISGKH